MPTLCGSAVRASVLGRGEAELRAGEERVALLGERPLLGGPFGCLVAGDAAVPGTNEAINPMSGPAAVSAVSSVMAVLWLVKRTSEKPAARR